VACEKGGTNYPLLNLAPDSCVMPSLDKLTTPGEYDHVSDGAIRCQAVGQEAKFEHVVDSVRVIMTFASRA
jgi:hypothetical protein